MPLTASDEGAVAENGARWQRRAARQDAERRRMPKHGKGYVTLAREAIARRGRAAAEIAATPPRAGVTRAARRPRSR